MTLEDDVAAAFAIDPAAQDALRALVRVVIWHIATQTVEDDTLTIGPLSIDRLRRIVTVDGNEHALKPRAARSACQTPGGRLYPGTIARRAWPQAEAVEDERTVDVHVRRLRSKLGAGLNVRTVHGVGYTLDPPDKKRKT